VIVAGYSSDGFTDRSTLEDFITIKYTPDGQQSWVNYYTYESYNSDIAVKLAVDASNNIYVTGSSDTNETEQDPDPDFFTIKYSPAGQRLWAARYGGVEISARPAAMVLDAAGNAYIAGSINNDCYSCGSYRNAPDYAVVKYSPEGEELWTARYNGLDDAIDVVTSMAMDAAGNVFVTGYSATGQPNSALYITSFTTIKYSPEGKQLWIDSYSNPPVKFGKGIVIGMTLDTEGNVYITGPSDENAIILKYSNDGKKLWATRSENDIDAPHFIALDNNNNIILGGNYLQDDQYDYVTTKYSQLTCATIPEVAVSEGRNPASATAAVQSTSTYSIPLEGMSYFNWRIKDRQEKILKTSGKSTMEMRWPEAGFYTIYLTYGNECEKKTIAHKVAVYDTGAGLVLGGGWIESGQHANMQYMQHEEKGYFGFVALYPSGSTDVWGKTVLVLRKNKMKFESSSQDPMRLIVYGDKANYTGKGSINGKGDYSFLVAAVDGRLSESTSTDKLRLKIWETSSGEVVYDNQAGGCDCQIPKTGIGQGEILIYKGELSLNLGSPMVAEAFRYVEPIVAHFYNYPNIFSDKTTISFALEEEENFVLEVFDMKGSLVRKVSNGHADAGKVYAYELDGTDLKEGIYIARLSTGSGAQSIKLMLQR
jgi:hypothetical protein